MSQIHDGSLEGLFERISSMVLHELLGNVPPSIVALGTVRRKDPELAKVLFTECFIAPTRRLLEGSAAVAYLDELESRARQDDPLILFRDWETLIVSELSREGFETILSLGQKLLTDDGYLNEVGKVWADGVVHDVRHRLALVVTSAERLVPVFLAAAIAGKDALEEEIERHREATRPSLLEAIENMLYSNGFDEHPIPLRQMMLRVGKASDRDLIQIQHALMGCYFWSAKGIRERVEAIIGVQKDIEF